MVLMDFVKKYQSKKVDFDGVYGAQCVDLFRQYSKEVLDIKEHTGAVEGAKELFTKYYNLPYEQKYFIRLDGGKNAYGFRGDVAIFDSTPTNIYGHVAIVISDEVTDLVVFEQNGFTQDGAKIAVRSKANLLGYLHKRERVY